MCGYTAALREAEASVDAATASGDVDKIAAAAHALIVAAAAHGWPTATALVFKYERTGPVAHLWGLWRVVDVDGRVLREWEDEPGDMTDESEEELVALDLITTAPRRCTPRTTERPRAPRRRCCSRSRSEHGGGPTLTGPARTRGRPPRPPSNAGRGFPARARSAARSRLVLLARANVDVLDDADDGQARGHEQDDRPSEHGQPRAA